MNSRDKGVEASINNDTHTKPIKQNLRKAELDFLTMYFHTQKINHRRSNSIVIDQAYFNRLHTSFVEKFSTTNDNRNEVLTLKKCISEYKKFESLPEVEINRLTCITNKLSDNNAILNKKIDDDKRIARKFNGLMKLINDKCANIIGDIDQLLALDSKQRDVCKIVFDLCLEALAMYDNREIDMTIDINKVHVNKLTVLPLKLANACINSDWALDYIKKNSKNSAPLSKIVHSVTVVMPKAGNQKRKTNNISDEEDTLETASSIKFQNQQVKRKVDTIKRNICNVSEQQNKIIGISESTHKNKRRKTTRINMAPTTHHIDLVNDAEMLDKQIKDAGDHLIDLIYQRSSFQPNNETRYLYLSSKPITGTSNIGNIYDEFFIQGTKDSNSEFLYKDLLKNIFRATNGFMGDKGNNKTAVKSNEKNKIYELEIINDEE